MVIFITGCATNQTKAPKAVYDTVWQWQGTDSLNDACVVSTPERYTLRFLQDGKVQARFDCNNGGGSYTISEGKLSFGPLMSTRMACELDSLDRRYMKKLQVVAFFVKNGIFYLELSGCSGFMRFRA